MFKVGDEVFIKAEITNVHIECDKPYFVHPNLDSLNWVSEEKVFPADKTYTQGLEDAWKLAKKIYNMTYNDIERIFGVEGGFYEVIRDYTYERALAKIDAFEKKIKVGDEVRCGNILGVVTDLETDCVSVMWKDGSVSDKCEWKELTKTGKHIDIESLLRQIGE